MLWFVKGTPWPCLSMTYNYRIGACSNDGELAVLQSRDQKRSNFSHGSIEEGTVLRFGGYHGVAFLHRIHHKTKYADDEGKFEHAKCSAQDLVQPSQCCCFYHTCHQLPYKINEDEHSQKYAAK